MSFWSFPMDVETVSPVPVHVISEARGKQLDQITRILRTQRMPLVEFANGQIIVTLDNGEKLVFTKDEQVLLGED